MKIIGFKAKKIKGSIKLERGYDGKADTLIAHSFDQACDFLTEVDGDIAVCANLSEFSDALFSFLPKDKQEELKVKPKVFVGDVKVFFTERLLGIGVMRGIKEGSNLVEKREINLYSLSGWLPDDTPDPQNALEVAKLGEKVVQTLNKMGIYPDKLSSPVAVWVSSMMDSSHFPTLYSFREEWLEAMTMCEALMRHEWREAHKIGFFEKAFNADLVSAYPSFIANLPSTDGCFCQKSDVYIKSDWAVMIGEVEVNAPVSPITYLDDEEDYINPNGKFPRVMTSEEAEWLDRWKAGSFRMTGNGWFFRWPSVFPYREVVKKLFAMRQNGDADVAHIARRVGQGISGKLDEDHKDGKLGDFYNPILALLTRSRCRLAVADFIYDNNLVDDVIAVQVDGVLSDTPVKIDETGKLGSWRLDAQCPAVVLGKGEVWLPHKRPLNIGYDDVIEAFKKHPNQSYYQFGDKVIDLPVMARDTGRVFKKFPKTGGEVLGGKYGSEPIKI